MKTIFYRLFGFEKIREPLLFLENSSGKIEWRFRTSQAQVFADALHKILK